MFWSHPYGFASTETGRARQNLERNEIMRQEFLRDIERARGKGDVDALKKIADAIKVSFREDDPAAYGQLMKAIVRSFSSQRYNGEWRRDLEIEYATKALQNNDRIPVEIELELLRHLQEGLKDAPFVATEEAIRQRPRLVRLWLHGLSRSDASVTPLPKMPDPPAVEPPIIGAPVESIPDPEDRARYREYLAKRAEVIKETNRLLDIQRKREWFRPLAINYVVSAYAAPPHAKDELERLLRESKVDDVTSEEIKRRVQEASRPVPQGQ